MLDSYKHGRNNMMMDKATAAPILNDTVKAKIKQWYGIDVDSDLFSPMVDFIFKRIFIADDIRSKTALLDLLNSLLGLDGAEKIVDLVVINPDIPVDVKTRSVYHFQGVLKSGHIG